MHRRPLLAASLAAPFLGRHARAQDLPRIDDPFPFAVASGDPRSDSVILWTRLARAALDPTPLAAGPLALDWVLAEDEALSRGVRRGQVVAQPAFGHSVHVEATGLDPDRAYFYAFRLGDRQSPVGRTRTLPEAQASVAAFRFALASCQHWENGFFDAYDGMIEDECRLVLHLGDYIYGVSRGGVRNHESRTPPRTLAEYRARHALYKTDAALRRAHLAMPFVVVPDNHDALEDDSDDPALLAQRAAAYQAWVEFLPVRAGVEPASPSMPIFRGIEIGRLIRLSVLDTRQFRASQHVCREGSDPRFAFGVYNRACAAAEAEARSMLGRPQEHWLGRRLAGSEARWNAIASTVPMAPLDMRHEGALYRYLYGWDGYPANRTRLLRTLAETRVANPIVLAGDIHATRIADLALDEMPVATELVGTSISSVWPEPLDAPMRAALASAPAIRHYRSDRRGYLRCTVTEGAWLAETRTIDRTDTPGGTVTTTERFAIEPGRVGAQRTL